MNDLKDLRPLKVKEFFRIQSPIELLGALGYYGIGAGIAYFVGTRINPTTLILGLLIGWCMQLAMSFLVSYFSLLVTPANFDDEDRWGLSPAIPKQTVLIFALVSLTMSAALTILLRSLGDTSGRLADITGRFHADSCQCCAAFEPGTEWFW